MNGFCGTFDTVTQLVYIRYSYCSCRKQEVNVCLYGTEFNKIKTEELKMKVYLQFEGCLRIGYVNSLNAVLSVGK